jgi:hypothetical protein
VYSTERERPSHRALVGASGGRFLAFALLLTVASCTSASGSRPDPLPDERGSIAYGNGLVGNEGLDIGDVELLNPTGSEATITSVSLQDGGGSQNALAHPRFFIAGHDRTVAGGIESAPSGSAFWGVDLEPALGYRIQPQGGQARLGALLVLRVRLNGLTNASFDGVEVTYEWEGDEYTFTSDLSVALCATTPRQSRLPKPCG